MAARDDLHELLESFAKTAESDGKLTLSAADASVVAREIETLHAGLATRETIGEAKGILMERYKVTSDGAFRMLAELSQHTNRKLIDVCRELRDTGALPPDPIAD